MARIETRDGYTLHAEAHGEGIPLVLSCALSTTHENWRSQVEPLVAAGVRVILWDFRGHGDSAAPSDPDRYSIEQVVDDMGRVLAAAAPDQSVVLAGLSFGGLASIHFALRHPERTRALALIDSGPVSVLVAIPIPEKSPLFDSLDLLDLFHGFSGMKCNKDLLKEGIHWGSGIPDRKKSPFSQ